MPADASATEAVLSRQRRIGLRVALAVAAGFTWNLATGAVIPFFGPASGVQSLFLGPGPLPLRRQSHSSGSCWSSDRPSLFLTASLATTRSSCWHCSVYSISYASSYRRGDKVAL